MKLPDKLGPIHFVGIGGIGMSGIAEVLLNLGYSVQGSDASENANVVRLFLAMEPSSGSSCAGRAYRGPYLWQPPKKQVRKSKKSWLLVAPSVLKSACPAKKSARKSKKSWEFRQSTPFQSQGQLAGGGKPATRMMRFPPP